MEEDNKENTRDEWEVLKEVARQFPDLGNADENVSRAANAVFISEKRVPDTNFRR